VKEKVAGAAHALRRGDLPAIPSVKKCAGCDYCGMCSAGARTVPPAART
jgi:hypothetical protein